MFPVLAVVLLLRLGRLLSRSPRSPRMEVSSDSTPPAWLSVGRARVKLPRRRKLTNSLQQRAVIFWRGDNKVGKKLQ